MNHHLHTLLALVALPLGLAAQRTWIVDRNNGPGTDFMDLPPAVQAAGPGDVIQVRPAPGQLYEAPVVSQPLTILGDRSSPPGLIGVFEVRNLPQGTSFALSGFKLGTIETIFQPTTRPHRGFVLADNAGAVHITALEYGIDPSVAAAVGTDLRGFLVERCTLVTISHSTIWGSNITTRVRDSVLVATDSRFRESSVFIPLHVMLETLFLQRSTVWLVDCDVIGTDGDPNGNFLGKPAVSLCEATLRICGASYLLGGYGIGRAAAVEVNGFAGCWPPGGARMPVVLYDPRASVFGTAGPLARELFEPVPALSWRTPASQGSLTTQQYAEAGSLTILAAGPMLQHPITSPDGTLFLDPTAVFVLDVGVADSGGLHGHTVPIPAALPVPTRLPLQAVELTAANGLRFTQAVMFGKY